MASRITRRMFTTSVRRLQDHQKAELAKETKRNPELLVRHNASAHPDNAQSQIHAQRRYIRSDNC